MSTIYTWHRECATLATPAAGDKMCVADTSATLKKGVALSTLASAALGISTSDTIGFYGRTPVNQGTMTATCLSALTTNPTFSASNTGAGVFGFSSSTVATAYVTRIQQMQADIQNLMTQIDSVGALGITGV